MASPSRQPEYDAMYKIVLVGDAGVGKTNMLGEELEAWGVWGVGARGVAGRFCRGRFLELNFIYSDTFLSLPP